MVMRAFSRLSLAAIAAVAIALTAAGVFGEPPPARADSGFCTTSGYEFDTGGRRFFSYTRPCPGVIAYYEPQFFNYDNFYNPFYNNFNYCNWCYGNQFYNFNPVFYTGFRGYGFGGY